MEKKRNQKGFTLAELLIVVAIIAVLVAIAIPVFTRQLERSRENTDLANVRSAYAELVTQYLEDGASQEATVPAKQTVASWQTTNPVSDYAYIGTDITTSGSNAATEIAVPCVTKGSSYHLHIDSTGSVYVSSN